MASCVSPIIASVYMEHIEHTVIITFHTSPVLWLKYVYDTLCILNKDHTNDFLHTSQFNIQFTIENEHKFSFPVSRRSRQTQ